MFFSSRCAIGLVTLLQLLAPRLDAQIVKRLELPRQPLASFTLTEKLRFGSLDGKHDAFGRIMATAFDSRGRIIVVDDFKKQVSVFSSDGAFVGATGRAGRGPGEFDQPWAVGVDPNDSIFVWDANLSRVTVFDSDLTYARTFLVPPQWLITSIAFLDDGNLLVAAYGPGETQGIHVLNRSSGGVIRHLGPPVKVDPAVAGFEASVLGGNLRRTQGGIVYTRKSPYEVFFISISGAIRHKCVGAREWTTNPADVIVRTGDGSGLEWNRYVHTIGILDLGGSRFLNVIRDPVNDRRVVDLIDSGCNLLRRTLLQGPVTFMDRLDERILTTRTLDFPEVVVYEFSPARR